MNQLTEGGTITVPLLMPSLTHSITFERDGDHLVGLSAKDCGFVIMQGASAHTERLLLLRGEEIGLRSTTGSRTTRPCSTERSTQSVWKSGRAW